MRLLRLGVVDINPNDRVFRHARLPALIVWLAVFGGDAAIFFSAFAGKWKPGYIIGSAILLLLLLFLRLVTARFHPSNWLVRANETGLVVQYRSYLNYQLSAEKPSVVLIFYSEIASARLVRECVETPDWDSGDTQRHVRRYVELELSGDIAPLANALQMERSEKPLMKKHWYGSSSTLYRDYPLTMTTPPFLRIRWDVVPGARKFLEYLSPHTRIADPVSLTQDLTHLDSLSREEQQNKLRDLAARGEIVTAAVIAQKLLGCSLAEAKRIVERFANGR